MPPLSPEDSLREARTALDQAIALHQEGRLEAAQQMYRRVLELAPAHPGAMHASGLIAHQLGQTDRALEWLQRSCELDPDSADFRYNLGVVLKSLQQWDQSRATLESAIAILPDHLAAHEALAEVLQQFGRSEEAERLSRRVAELRQPREVSFEEAIGMAKQWHKQGRLDDARNLYDRLLAAAPDHPEALHFRGMLAAQLGQFEEALVMLQRAARLDPENASIANNLGNALKQLRRSEEAAEAYRRAIELDSTDASPHNNRGLLLRERGLWAEAAEEFQTAIRLDPEREEAYCNLGLALNSCGHPEEAERVFRRAIELSPERSSAYRPLCEILICAGRIEEAGQLARLWVGLQPENPLARHALAAVTGENVPARASDDYVRNLFDQMAAAFDEHLVSVLAYRAPQLVTDAAMACLGDRARFDAVLDAGCGTGLCGPLLRPVAALLSGVDLSTAMLHRAAVRNVYDELVQGELTLFLEQHPGAFDLIVSADTLVYFGDLAPVFASAHAALRPDGRLIFTVERAPDADSAPFRLNPHGRYSHTKTAVQSLLDASGFAVLDIKEEVLRKESGDEVAGLLVVAGRS